ARRNRRTKLLPMNPAPPVTTKRFTAAEAEVPLDDLDPGVVAHHELVSARPGPAAHQLDVLADQAVGNLGVDVDDRAVLQDDAVLDLRVADHAAVVDGGVRPNVAVLDHRAAADDP